MGLSPVVADGVLTIEGAAELEVFPSFYYGLSCGLTHSLCMFLPGLDLKLIVDVEDELVVITPLSDVGFVGVYLSGVLEPQSLELGFKDDESLLHDDGPSALEEEVESGVR